MALRLYGLPTRRKIGRKSEKQQKKHSVCARVCAFFRIALVSGQVGHVLALLLLLLLLLPLHLKQLVSCVLQPQEHGCNCLSPWRAGKNGACSRGLHSKQHRMNVWGDSPHEHTWSMTCGKILPLASPVCQMSFDRVIFWLGHCHYPSFGFGKIWGKKTQRKIIKNKKGKENLKKISLAWMLMTSTQKIRRKKKWGLL